MIGKDQILDFVLRECDTCLHLYGKIPEGGLDYRPTPEQRSTLELLRYLSFCALGGARTMVDGNWDGYKELAEAASSMEADEFPAAMERQKDGLRQLFAGLTQEDLETRTATLPVGDEVPLEIALVLLPQHWMVGYRMQLFLYAKQAGNKDIWTPNCWVGIDMERPEAVPESA